MGKSGSCLESGRLSTNSNADISSIRRFGRISLRHQITQSFFWKSWCNWKLLKLFWKLWKPGKFEAFIGMWSFHRKQQALTGSDWHVLVSEQHCYRKFCLPTGLNEHRRERKHHRQILFVSIFCFGIDSLITTVIFVCRWLFMKTRWIWMRLINQLSEVRRKCGRENRILFT